MLDFGRPGGRMCMAAGMSNPDRRSKKELDQAEVKAFLESLGFQVAAGLIVVALVVMAVLRAVGAL